MAQLVLPPALPADPPPEVQHWLQPDAVPVVGHLPVQQLPVHLPVRPVLAAAQQQLQHLTNPADTSHAPPAGHLHPVQEVLEGARAP